jgi:uncharacterized protein YdaU (DUF1376 family)
MNYFEHHIGDYAEATAHLTFVEDAAYSRMIRKYYAQEKPLPADVKAVQRLVGARTKEEKIAVETVLQEFFSLEADGWHQARCDQAIAEFLAGEPEREAKKSNEEARLKRHRDERARLFSLLNDAGQHAPWNIGMNELRELVKRVAATGAQTPLPPLPATAPATPATATQSPITNTHTPIIETSSQASNEVGPDQVGDDDRLAPPLPTARNVQIALLLRAQGVQATSQHPVVCVTWAGNPRVTDEVLNVAITKAKAAKGDKGIPLAYLVPIVEQELQALDGPPPATVRPAQASPPAPPRKPQGLDPKGTDESYDEYQARVTAYELAKRNGGKAA